jgi:diketogulonate reductase-like aldo/keto reductase
MPVKHLKNGLSLPELGLGTWKIGGERTADHSRDAEWTESIQAAIRLGYSHIDTASMYGVGHAEELVGEAVKDFKRESLFVATKVFATELSYDRFIASAKASLGRLGMEYVDLLYIHAPNKDIPLSETMRAMDTLIAEGIVKNIGVSNFTVELLKEAQSNTKNKIVANQIEYNLKTREHSNYGGCTGMESEIVPYCQENDIFIVAFKPLDRGVILEPNTILDEIAAKYGKTRAQVAINWLVSQPNVLTVAMSNDVEHLKENLDGTGWSMESGDIERLRLEYPSDRG